MSKKTLITLPWVGLTDIEEIRPIVDTLAFQKSKRRLQLGFSDIVYSNANSSRGLILLVTWVFTKRITKHLVKRGCISKKTAHDINLTALLHDIGHGPGSHAIEVMTTRNHVQNGAKILREDEELRKAIYKCDGDPDYVASCLEGKIPEFAIVDDKNLGTDKLVYLVMAHHDTDFGPDISRLVENIVYNIAYKDGEIMIDVRALDALSEVQNAYRYFYKDLFLSRPASRVQRFMQKTFFYLLNAPASIGGFTEEELWPMTDEELKARMITSSHPAVKCGYQTYARGISAFPETGLVIKPTGHGYREQTDGGYVIMEINKNFFDKFYRSCDPVNLERMERGIAHDIINIPYYQVIVTNITKMDVRRFIPKDIKFFNSATYPRGSSLKENKPEHFKVMAEDLDDYISVRVCASPPYRQRIIDKRIEIFKFIESYVYKNKNGV